MNTLRVAILISGGGSNMAALVDSMSEGHPARPCIVLADTPEAEGLAKAAKRGIPVACVDHRKFRCDRDAFDAKLLDTLSESAPDIVCLAGFMRILGTGFVARFRGRILNIHPSLLPRHKGLNTHARVLAAGDIEHGCTVHLVTERLDDGPVLGQSRLGILPNDTPETLGRRVLKLEHRLYPQVLRHYASGDRCQAGPLQPEALKDGMGHVLSKCRGLSKFGVKRPLS